MPSCNQPTDVPDLSRYFQLPEKVVAKELGICLTSLKKLCRQQGINRWPYRKIKSMDKKLGDLVSKGLVSEIGPNYETSSTSSPSPTNSDGSDISVATTPCNQPYESSFPEPTLTDSKFADPTFVDPALFDFPALVKTCSEPARSFPSPGSLGAASSPGFWNFSNSSEFSRAPQHGDAPSISVRRVMPAAEFPAAPAPGLAPGFPATSPSSQRPPAAAAAPSDEDLIAMLACVARPRHSSAPAANQQQPLTQSQHCWPPLRAAVAAAAAAVKELAADPAPEGDDDEDFFAQLAAGDEFGSCGQADHDPSATQAFEEEGSGSGLASGNWLWTAVHA